MYVKAQDSQRTAAAGQPWLKRQDVATLGARYFTTDRWYAEILSALLLTAGLQVLKVSPAQSELRASLFICIAPDNVTLFVLHAGSDLEARLCCTITNYPLIDMYLCSASQTALPAQNVPSARQPNPIEIFLVANSKPCCLSYTFTGPYNTDFLGNGIICMRIVSNGMLFGHQETRCSAYWQSALQCPGQNGQRHQGLLPSLGAFTCLLHSLMFKHS